MGLRLSRREREIVGALCMGETLTELAARLCISRRTAESHVRNAKVKLGARTIPQCCYEYVTRYKSEI